MLRRNVAGAARLLKILTKAAPATKWRDALCCQPEGRAAVASVALPSMGVQSPAPNAATTERGPPDHRNRCAQKWRIRQCPSTTANAATTERGPPGHPKTCAQNAHKFRRKILLTFAIRGDTEHQQKPCMKRSLRFAKINNAHSAHMICHNTLTNRFTGRQFDRPAFAN